MGAYFGHDDRNTHPTYRFRQLNEQGAAHHKGNINAGLIVSQELIFQPLRAIDIYQISVDNDLCGANNRVA